MSKINFKTENTLLTGLNCLLTLASVGFAIHDSIKSVEYITEIKNKQDIEPDDVSELLKTTVKCYTPTLVITSITLGSIIVTGIRNNKIQALLGSTAAAYLYQYNKYRKYTINTVGNDVDMAIIDRVAEDQYMIQKNRLNKEREYYDDYGNPCLFFDNYSGRFFWNLKEDVLAAEYEFNRLLTLQGEAELATLYSYLGIPNSPEYFNIGWGDWCFYTEECDSDPVWIEIIHKQKQLSDGTQYIDIFFKHYPRDLF